METGIIKAFPTPFLIEKIDSMVIDTPDFNSEHWKLDSVDTVSYTHLTLPTICSV